MDVFIYTRQTGTQPELVQSLRQSVENRGGRVVAIHTDDTRIIGKGKYAAWRNVVAHLDGVDQIALATVADIPGRTVNDLLKILAILRSHGVHLYLHAEGIGTDGPTVVMLDIIDAYKKAKLSEAIRTGMAKAVAAGKRVGRPIVPIRIQTRIRDALADGGGIRPTARRFNVSPASVINIRRSMTVNQCATFSGCNSTNCGDNLAP